MYFVNKNLVRKDLKATPRSKPKPNAFFETQQQAKEFQSLSEAKNGENKARKHQTGTRLDLFAPQPMIIFILFYYKN